MAKSVTLTTMILQAREAADMVGSAFVTDAEITSLINTYVAELYDLLVSSYGPSHYADSYTFSTVSGQREYALPSNGDGADFYQLLGVDVDFGGGDVISAVPFDFYSRNKFSPSTSYVRGQPVYYRLHGSQIWLIPVPVGVFSVTMHYIPAAPTLSTGGPVSSFDGINGWERYAVVSAAIAMLQKEESDPSVYLAEKASLVSRIQSMSKHRDAGMPERIVDVRGRLRGGMRGGWGE